MYSNLFKGSKDQPRDKDGQWTSGGSGSAGGPAGTKEFGSRGALVDHLDAQSITGGKAASHADKVQEKAISAGFKLVSADYENGPPNDDDDESKLPSKAQLREAGNSILGFKHPQGWTLTIQREFDDDTGKIIGAHVSVGGKTKKSVISQVY